MTKTRGISGENIRRIVLIKSKLETRKELGETKIAKKLS